MTRTYWTPRERIRDRVYAMRALGYRWTACYRAEGQFHGIFAVLVFIK